MKLRYVVFIFWIALTPLYISPNKFASVYLPLIVFYICSGWERAKGRQCLVSTKVHLCTWQSKEKEFKV